MHNVVIFLGILVAIVFFLRIIFTNKKKETKENTTPKPYKSIVEYDRKEIKRISYDLILEHISNFTKKDESIECQYLVDKVINRCKEKNIPYTIEKVNELFSDVAKNELVLKSIDIKMQDIKKQEEKLAYSKEQEKIRKEVFENDLKYFKQCIEKISIEIENIVSITSYSVLKETHINIVSSMIDSVEKKYDIKNHNTKHSCKTFITETLLSMIEKKKLYLFKKSPLENYFNAIEGGETTLYYLKLKNKFGETRYKIGVTLNDVKTRYKGQNSEFTILYEKKITHANTIEKQILNEFKHLITDECLLGTYGNEIFKEDVLKLDK